MLTDVPVGPKSLAGFEHVLAEAEYAELAATIARARSLIGERVIWNVNSTARGGGVAELLQSLVAYVRGVGFDCRWTVVSGDDDFFEVTKRIHNRLHGAAGDGGPLGDQERAVYDRITAANARDLAAVIQPGDLVLLHDPQTAGLVEPLVSHGARVIWRCHVGLDSPNELARSAWEFLRPYVTSAEAYVFSRAAFAWEDLDATRLCVIPPSIDVFTPKNQEMPDEAVAAILARTGLIDAPVSGEPIFTDSDGKPARVSRRAEVVEDGPLPPEAPLVTQVSRWDRLKDPAGVLASFTEHVAPHTDGHLLLVGPAVAAVSDDPEGAEVFREVVAQSDGLSAVARERVHLALLPMDDLDENAAIVNAIQRRSDVVCQKSLAEGFGLTVAEAMWKARPVVASAVGGILDQIIDGETGILVEPRDLEAFGRAVRSLLADPARATAIGERAKARVRDHFLGPRHLTQYVDLFERVLRAAQ